jgi:hypothetical protein
MEGGYDSVRPCFEALDPEPDSCTAYDFEIVDAAVNVRRHVLKVTARVLNGEMEGRVLTAGYAIADDMLYARGRMKALAEATGVPLDENGGFNRVDLLGRRLTADVIVDVVDSLSPTGWIKRKIVRWVSERPSGVLQG